MPATVVLDEVQLTFRIPAALPAGEVKAIRRVLRGRAFTAALRRAVLSEVNKSLVMTPVRVALTR